MKSLSPAAVSHYNDRGYYAPVRVLSPAEASAMRGKLEAHERAHGPLKGPMRHKSHLLFTWLDDLIRHPAILDAVEDLIGPDILVYTSTWFIKEPESPAIAAWQLLHSMGHFPSSAPHTLSAALVQGQLTIEQLVDRSRPQTPGIRDLFVEYLRRSGYTDVNRPIVLTTPFSEDLASGHTFAPRHITDVIPGRVYALSGFEFTEYYFVVSEDRRELIGIDAGTRPDSAKAAYEALRAYAPNLPELTTIFITHSHWDHIGGHTYFRALNPPVRFYARSNYAEEIAHDLNQPGIFDKQFFGERFSLDDELFV